MTLLPKARIDAFLSNSVFIFLTRFFPALAALAVQILYSRYLNKDDYGQYQNFWIQLYVFSAIASAGIHVFIITYPPEFIVRLLYRIKRVQYGYYFMWLVVAAACFAYMQYEAGNRLFVPFLFLIAHVITAIAEASLIVFKKLKGIAAINFAYALLFCLIHWLVVQQLILLNEVFYCLLLLLIIKLVVYLVLNRSYILTHKRLDFANEASMAGVGKLWMHLGLYDFLQVFTRWIDKFVISLLFAEHISAVYFNGAVDIPFLPLILGAAGSATLIQLAGRSTQSEPGYTIELAHRSSRILSCIVFPLFFFFVVFRYELFEVVFTNKFISAVPIFLASSLAIPLRAYSFSTVLQNRNKGAIINAGALLDLALALLLMYPFYLVWGLPGIALSFAFATYVQAFFYLFYTSRVIKVTMLQLIPYKNWLMKLIVFAALFIGIHYISEMVFTSKIILILGLTITAIAVIVSLFIELKQTAKPNVPAEAEKY